MEIKMKIILQPNSKAVILEITLLHNVMETMCHNVLTLSKEIMNICIYKGNVMENIQKIIL